MLRPHEKVAELNHALGATRPNVLPVLQRNRRTYASIIRRLANICLVVYSRSCRSHIGVDVR